jgi:hypothetical protein
LVSCGQAPTRSRACVKMQSVSVQKIERIRIRGTKKGQLVFRHTDLRCFTVLLAGGGGPWRSQGMQRGGRECSSSSWWRVSSIYFGLSSSSFSFYDSSGDDKNNRRNLSLFSLRFHFEKEANEHDPRSYTTHVLALVSF